MTNEKDRKDESRLPDEGRSLEQIISAAAEEQFAALPSEPMTLERLHAMSAAGHTALRKRRCRVLGGIAAVLILTLLGTFIAINTLPVDVGADKNRKEEIRTEDGVVIEDGGYGAEYEDGNVWSTDDWEAVAAAQTLYPQLMIPEYIPEGYIFYTLYIEQLDANDIVAKYTYGDREENFLEIELFFTDVMLISSEMDDIDRILESAKGKIYLQEKDDKRATLQLDDGVIVRVWSKVSDKELVMIVDNLTI